VKSMRWAQAECLIMGIPADLLDEAEHFDASAEQAITAALQVGDR
jgi:hypothetical protein